MSDPQWDAFDAFVEDFLLRNFAQSSIKRETEWDTIWFAAENEGGRRFITQFVRELEDEARKVDTA